MSISRGNQVIILRKTRTFHRFLGIFLFAILVWVAVTGLLLGWKKNSGGLLLPTTQRTQIHPNDLWLSPKQINLIAASFFKKEYPRETQKIDRFEIRYSEGIYKVVAKPSFREIQIHGTSGKILSDQLRYSDWIEKLHDGSFIDYALKNETEWFKLFFTTLVASSLILFSLSGFWLWVGPKLLRNNR